MIKRTDSEWADDGDPLGKHCPSCGGYESAGHVSGCPVIARWLVWNKSYDLYAGEVIGSWTGREKAKRFKRREIASQIARVLTVADQGHCQVVAA